MPLKKKKQKDEKEEKEVFFWVLGPIPIWKQRPIKNICVSGCAFADSIDAAGNAIVSFRPSVRPFVSTLSSEPTDR